LLGAVCAVVVRQRRSEGCRRVEKVRNPAPDIARKNSFFFARAVAGVGGWGGFFWGVGGWLGGWGCVFFGWGGVGVWFGFWLRPNRFRYGGVGGCGVVWGTPLCPLSEGHWTLGAETRCPVRGSWEGSPPNRRSKEVRCARRGGWGGALRCTLLWGLGMLPLFRLFRPGTPFKGQASVRWCVAKVLGK